MIKADELKKFKEAKLNTVLADVEHGIVMYAKAGYDDMQYKFPDLSESNKKHVIKILEDNGYQVTRHRGDDQRDGTYDYLRVYWN